MLRQPCCSEQQQQQCTCAVVIVDHGSRRKASNDMLLEFCQLYQQMTQHPIVEPAHMEIAEPSIAQAIGACGVGPHECELPLGVLFACFLLLLLLDGNTAACTHTNARDRHNDHTTTSTQGGV